MFVAENPGPRKASMTLAPSEGDTGSGRGLELDAFDPKLFRQNAELVVSRLEQYLSDPTVRGLALTNPSVLRQAAQALMDTPSSETQKLGAIIDLYIKTGIQVHSPGYMGRQFSGVVPLAGMFDMVNSMVNQPSSFYEAGQLPNVVERIMADEFNRFIGWEPGSFAMVTTSGGSLANLTALLAARNDKFPGIWSEGTAALKGSLRPAIAVGEDAHYSVSRAAGIMGLGENHLVRLPLNRHRQIDLKQVRPTLAAAVQRGLHVFALVASAGTTPVGAFDPIEALAEMTREKNIWLHIDGAHGGGFLVADELRGKLQGIEKADSFLLDAHKTLFVPAVCTLLFYKDKHKSYGAFQQTASYVFENEPDIYTEFDSAAKSFECTKRPLIMNLWVLWTLYGRTLFSAKLEYLCRLAMESYRILKAEQDFQTLHQPEANILCFRYIPPRSNAAHIPNFQGKIRNKIREGGKFFISKVDLDGESALRVVFMNHLTTTGHFRGLLEEIRETGSALLARPTPPLEHN